MHYIGMAAVRSAATIAYDAWLVAVSVIIAITASFAALRLFISFRDPAVDTVRDLLDVPIGQV